MKHVLPRLMLVTAFFWIGCSPHPAHAPNQNAALSRTSAISHPLATLTVQQKAVVRLAHAAYRGGGRAEARSRLNSLLSGSLHPAARSFLERQAAIATGSNSARAIVRQEPVSQTRSTRNADCGPRALALICQRLQIAVDERELAAAAKTNAYGTTLEGLKFAAMKAGLRAEGIQVNKPALASLKTSAIAWVDGDHYIAVLRVEGDQAITRDPNRSAEEALPLDTLIRRSGGILLRLSKAAHNPRAVGGGAHQ